ncbi:hypothetical protein CR513_62583, partial [Mucuna pruriens]
SFRYPSSGVNRFAPLFDINYYVAVTISTTKLTSSSLVKSILFRCHRSYHAQPLYDHFPWPFLISTSLWCAFAATIVLLSPASLTHPLVNFVVAVRVIASITKAIVPTARISFLLFFSSNSSLGTSWDISSPHLLQTWSNPLPSQGSSNYVSWPKEVKMWCIGQGLKNHLYTKLENVKEDGENWEKNDALLCTLLWQSIDSSLQNIYTNFDTCYELRTQAKSFYTNDTQRLFTIIDKLLNLH